MNKLPSHKASLTITHNQHKNYYETVEEYFKSRWNYFKESFIDDEAMKRCIDKNEIWEMHWYPETPVGFHNKTADTLEGLLNEEYEQ